MKYNEGDKVRVKSKEWYNNNKDEYGNVHLISKYGWMFTERDSRFCGKVVTILLKGTTSYAIVEDSCEGFWTDEMFECKVEKDMTRKEALTCIYNDDHMSKETLIEKIGEKYFNEFITIGFLTTNLGTRYWLTDLGRQYCLEMFS